MYIHLWGVIILPTMDRAWGPDDMENKEGRPNGQTWFHKGGSWHAILSAARKQEQNIVFGKGGSIKFQGGSRESNLIQFISHGLKAGIRVNETSRRLTCRKGEGKDLGSPHLKRWGPRVRVAPCMTFKEIPSDTWL